MHNSPWTFVLSRSLFPLSQLTKKLVSEIQEQNKKYHLKKSSNRSLQLRNHQLMLFNTQQRSIPMTWHYFNILKKLTWFMNSQKWSHLLDQNLCIWLSVNHTRFISSKNIHQNLKRKGQLCNRIRIWVILVLEL